MEISEAVRKLKETTERRANARRTYQVVQSIAPYDGEELPRAVGFCPVRCRDLSEGGFSFVLPEEPAFEHVVVSLGKPPAILHVAARVVRISRPPVLRGDYLVGCRFERRLKLPG